MKRLVATVACCTLSCGVFGDEREPVNGRGGDAVDEPEPLIIDTYVGPRSVRLSEPEYPEALIHRNQEGWVALNFMVDTEGRAYEISVADAVGDEAFQDAAIRALQRSRFEPATLGGEPIEAGANYAYSFALRGGREGARRRFVRRFRALLDAVQSGDRDAADAALAKLEADNLYENAYLEYGRFERHRRWGTVHQQIRALHRAVGREEATRYLPDDVYGDALRHLFALQVERQDFGGALKTANRLFELPLEEDLKRVLHGAVEDIEAVRHQDATFAVGGEISHGAYSWHLTLFRNAFHIDRVDGRLAEIKLRCAGKFVGFGFDEDLVYRVSERYMPCTLEVVGDPGTRFRLVQSPNRSDRG